MTGGDTIAAIATAPGRGGVAVVRVSGAEAFAVAERLSAARDSSRPVRLAKIRRPDGTTVDECLVLFFKAPHSYTGEDVVEFQCHGGTVTPRRVLDACFAAGARLARRGEFTERAFLNGKLDYDQAESVLDLIDAKTARAADAALRGLAGNKVRELRALYNAALDLSVTIEHALDVDEGELPPDFLPSVTSRLSDLANGLREAIRRANEGKILRDGALVVLAGPPNAGKSSLMNALLDESRAIVSDVPGTTRDSIEEWLDLDGWPIRLVDTAGLRETADAIEAEGVRRSEELIDRADVVVCLGTCGRLADRIAEGRRVEITAKCDLMRGEGLNVSAHTGEGLEDLKRTIVAKLEERASSAGSLESDSLDLSPLHEAFSLVTGLGDGPLDLVLSGNAVRQAANRLGTMVGAVYGEDLMNNLFSRFCVGK